jgi:hypothetical protein
MAHTANFWGCFLQHLILRSRHFVSRVLDRLDYILVPSASAHIA